LWNKGKHCNKMKDNIKWKIANGVDWLNGFSFRFLLVLFGYPLLPIIAIFWIFFSKTKSFNELILVKRK